MMSMMAVMSALPDFAEVLLQDRERACHVRPSAGMDCAEASFHAQKDAATRPPRGNSRLARARRCSIACPTRIADANYVARFTFPEFTAICPVTGQPDFATLVIDYVPRAWLVESKSLKLYLNSFRNHGAFHEECTVSIGKKLVAVLKPKWLRIGGYFHPRGGMPIDVFWQAGKLAARHLGAGPGRRYLSRPRIASEPVSVETSADVSRSGSAARMTDPSRRRRPRLRRSNRRRARY